MGTTTNNGWPTPVATDLVKDGWEAIKDLGDAIDTTLGVYAPSTSGLTLINTTSFSGVSSQSVNDVFSTTYDNYKIIITGLISSLAEINMRLRVGGADNSTASSYVKNQINGNDTSVTGTRVTSNLISFGAFDPTIVNAQILEVFNPFLTSTTGFISSMSRSGSGAVTHLGTGTHNQSTSYTGFTILPASGTITGSVSVYGYNK